MKKFLIAACVLLTYLPITTHAQDFVYQPINPAFGGNPYNYSWLLAQAQAQNSFKEEEAAPVEDDPLASLQESINRQILNGITQEFYKNQFGEDGLTEGYYKLGSYEIDISAVPDGMQVRIIDVVTGSETTIIIPYY